MSTTSSTRRSFEQSLKWKERDAVVGGNQQHKRRQPPQPVMADRGQGSHFWDVDGNEYIDYLMAWGPITLGYGYPRVVDAVAEAIKKGNVYNVGHPLEIELAEKLVELIPCAERAAFFLGGSDATTAAVKLARAYTGREYVIQGGYHGWHDWCAPGRGALEATTKYTLSSGGIDELTETFKAHEGNIACIIMETASHGLPEKSHLENVKKLVHDHDALLIFDEVKTGFRYALGGAQEYFDVTPDMAVFGKGMANGFATAAVVGSREIMEDVSDVWVAATFHGEVSMVAAALATIAELEEKDGIGHMWRQGDKLLAGYREIVERLGIAEYARIQGAGPMPFFGLDAKDDETMEKFIDIFYKETLEGGLHLPPGHIWFMCLSHTDEDIAHTLEVSESALKRAKAVI